ncbi:cUT1 family carbohydrate ABC transporter TC 3.A.1.1.-ATP-binding protein [Firmicutes bacterium CAG:449]|nr:cUT1 family carbohydrate ABC transporter TC 3.A.1.1.-ATP-binding protein [Firmicutes bacterium CAG:449]
MSEKDRLITLDKEQKRQEEKVKKIKEKQLYKQRCRIYDDMVKKQKINSRKIKNAPKDAYISLRHINKIYDNKVQAVFDFNLDIKQREFVVFVGPSGCGKSTTLRMIAGLEDITAGDLFIDKTYANDLHPKDRDIAMVFQSYALYPHMTVAGNMSFGLRIKKFPTLKVDENNNPVLGINKKAIKVLQGQYNNLNKYYDSLTNDNEKLDLEKDLNEIKEKIEYLQTTPVEVYENKHLPKEEIRSRVEKAAQILQISEYLGRKPKALSGGQCQRVALGRAIVKNAKVFLMDEPLSNLDAKLRVAMRSEIIKLHNALNATTIYVTHDQTEAMTMATRIVVMNKGYIQQIGTPIEIYNHPANVFVATFIGSPAMNLISARFVKEDVILPKGTTIKLGKDFKKAVKEFYENEKFSLTKELEELEENFVEKKEYEEKIKDIEEKIKHHSTKILENDLKKLQEEYKLCLESNSRRNYLIDALEKINALDLKKEIPVIFGIRPEDIYQANRILTDEEVSQEFKLKVSVAELLGHEYYVHTDFEGNEIVSKIHAKTLVNTGDELNLVFDLSKIHLFDTITEKLIK